MMELARGISGRRPRCVGALVGAGALAEDVEPDAMVTIPLPYLEVRLMMMKKLERMEACQCAATTEHGDQKKLEKNRKKNLEKWSNFGNM